MEYKTFFFYENFTVKLCAKCALQALEDGEQNVYSYECDNCGKKCDWGTELEEFMSFQKDEDLFHSFHFQLCCECAMNELDDLETYDDYDV